MEDRNLRIVEDLSGELQGEICCDPVTTAIHASNASLYQIRPLAVAFPKDAGDVRTLARYAAEQELPLVPRGAGTNVAGGSVGAGLVVDFARYMNRFLADDGDTIRVETGMVRDRLNERLRDSGRYFAPDPATSSITTIGGMLATNAAGSHSIHIGTTREHVVGLETVLAGGEIFEATSRKVIGEEGARVALLRESIGQLLVEHAELIESKRPVARRNNCGYHVWDCATSEGVDLSRLLVGSEGTLGLFSAATLRVLPIPSHRGVVLLLFDRLETALDAVLALVDGELVDGELTACDLLDRRLLSLARDADPRFESLIAADAEAGLLVEVIGASDAETERKLDALERRTHSLQGRVAARAASDEAVRFLWTLPGKVVPRLTHLRGSTRPLPIIEDVAVPPAAMREFCVRAQRVFQRHRVTATLYAHAGDGQMHFRPFLAPPEMGGSGVLMEALARDLYQVALTLGGVVSGEHGDGLARTAFIRTQFGPLYRVFQQIKRVFDPQDLLNPGKIISDDPKATIRHLRPQASPGHPLTDLNLRWKDSALVEEANRCNGCGECRSQLAGLRMCPFFRVDQVESAAPRSKAAAIRAVATRSLSEEEYLGEDMARLMSQCFNCKQCERECPSEVDIPHLVIEAKAARVAAQDQKLSDWALARVHLIAPVGNGLSFLANPLLSSPFTRWLLEKTVGLARWRKVPRFARESFLKSMPRRCRTWPRGGSARPIIYFVDDYANYFDPELALAFVRVCERQGIPVYVPPEQVSSGMSLFSAGDLNAARQLAEENLRVLGPYAREGHLIVCSEPSAAVCLRREYPYLLDHPDVEAVARQTREAGRFLWDLHQAGRLNSQFHEIPWRVAYHTPCHVRSENPMEPLYQLMGLIPELSIQKVRNGCSGMAGAWGLSQENYETSIKIGWPLIEAMREESLTCGVTECASCKFQMEQGTTRPTIHPLKLMDWSYAGQCPPLSKGTGRLVTT